MAPRLGWNESHRSSPGDKMKFSSLLPLPKGHLRKRSKAKSEISPSKDKVKLILPYQVHTHVRATESTPDLVGLGEFPLPRSHNSGVSRSFCSKMTAKFHQP